jgi:heme-degrading monooxygenase HmoA
MAVAVVYRPPAMTAQQYKESWTGGDSPVQPPPGLVFHAGVGDGNDFFTISVWNSREDYEAFAPVFARAMEDRGFHIGKPQILPVHQMLPPP